MKRDNVIRAEAAQNKGSEDAVTPKWGGQIIVESIETLDSPGPYLSSEELRKKSRVAMSVLRRWKTETAAQAEKREAFEELVRKAAADSANDSMALTRLIQGVLSDRGGSGSRSRRAVPKRATGHA